MSSCLEQHEPLNVASLSSSHIGGAKVKKSQATSVEQKGWKSHATSVEQKGRKSQATSVEQKGEPTE